MVDQSRVRSGYDVEILLGERELGYLLLGLVDAGSIPSVFEVGDPPVPVGLRGPAIVDRTYELLSGAPLPEPALDSDGAFEVEILSIGISNAIRKQGPARPARPSTGSRPGLQRAEVREVGLLDGRGCRVGRSPTFYWP